MALIFERPREFRFLTFMPPLVIGICASFLLIQEVKTVINEYFYIVLGLALFSGIILSIFSFKRDFSGLYLFVICLIIIAISYARTERFICQPVRQDYIGQQIIFKAGLDRVAKKSDHYQKLIATLTLIKIDSSTIPLNQQILLRIKNEFFENLSPGDTISGIGYMNPIQSAKNPETFDAGWYYKTQNILYQINSTSAPFIKPRIKSFHIPTYARKSQYYLKQILNEQFDNTKTRGLMNALLIGDKIELNKQIKEVFTKTGAAHILAVSGFHLGIIFIILWRFLGAVSKGSNKARFFKLLIYLLSIWSYAFITGNSPSVCRAASMLSIVLIGQSIQRNPSIWNNIGLSACILLLYNPLYIFQVGFQLSYAAIAGIILFTNKLYRLISIPNKIFKYFWAIICMSISAQTFILPICIYYFHQFPITFIISGLIAIPAATILVILGILLILTHLILPALSKFLAYLIDYLVDQLVNILSFLGQLQPIELSSIYLSGFQLFLILISIATILILIQKRNSWAFGLVIICASFSCYKIGDHQIKRQNFIGIFIYHNFKNPTIDLVSNRRVITISNDPINTASSYTCGGVHLKYNIQNQTHVSFDEDYTQSNFIKRKAHVFFDQCQIIVVDRESILLPHLYQTTKKTIFWIIDQRNEAFNAEQIPENSIIVFDSGVPEFVIDKLKRKVNNKTMIYQIRSSGAFKLKL